MGEHLCGISGTRPQNARKRSSCGCRCCCCFVFLLLLFVLLLLFFLCCSCCYSCCFAFFLLSLLGPLGQKKDSFPESFSRGQHHLPNACVSRVRNSKAGEPRPFEQPALGLCGVGALFLARLLHLLFSVWFLVGQQRKALGTMYCPRSRTTRTHNATTGADVEAAVPQR